MLCYQSRNKWRHCYQIILLVLMTPFGLLSQVKNYRQLPELPLSNVFTVEIRQGKGIFHKVFTYGVPVTEMKHVTAVEHIALFGFEPAVGPAELRISLKDGTMPDSSVMELVNKTLENVQVTFEGKYMMIRLWEVKKQLFVRLKKDHSQPLNLFADPYQEPEIPGNAKVYRFKASRKPYVMTEKYDRFTVPDDVDVVVIEDGALVRGTIHTGKDRIKPLRLTGRGMVIGNGGILNGPANIPYNAVVLTKGKGNSVEGITVMKSRHFSLDIGEAGHIDNVKLFGYSYNNDGFVAGDNSLIENCFLKVNDDHIKLYHDHIHVRNCTFYVQNNGAVFQFAWNKINPGDHCLVENCEVVAVEYKGCGDPVTGDGGLAHCFISLREQQADNQVMMNDTIRNVLIQGQLLRFIGLNGYSRQGIDVKGLLVENVRVLEPPKWYSWIYTKDPYRMDILFRNVVLGNHTISEKDFRTLGNVKLQFESQGVPFPEIR